MLQSLAFLNWPVVLAVVAVFVLLHLRGARSFAWTLACFAGIYAFLRFGFATPIPSSVVQLYMGITALALAAYVSSSATRRAEFLAPLVALVNEPRLRPVLAATLVLLPALAAGNVYLGSRETAPHRSPTGRKAGVAGIPATRCVPRWNGPEFTHSFAVTEGTEVA